MAAFAFWSIHEGLALGLFQFGTPAPGLFPFIFGVILAMAAILALCMDLVVLPSSATGPENLDNVVTGGSGRVVGYLVIGVAWTLAMGWIGFVPATALALLGLLRVVERTSWGVSVAVAVGATTVAYFLFIQLLSVPLPAMHLVPL